MSQSIPRFFAAVGLAALGGMSLLSSSAWAQQALPAANPKIAPVNDTFYTSPSDGELAAAAPGAVLRYRALPGNALPSNVKEGWQLMYRTANGKDQPVAMITTLFIPDNAPATGRKLLSYQAFYDSLTLNCSPSGEATADKLVEKAFFSSALSKGILVAVSDYEGLASQWIAAKNSAHGVLDGIRAVENFSKSGLNASTPVGMMGYSGGGFATTWAAELAPSYAPELNIIGAAAGGLPVNPTNVAKKVDGTFFAGAYFGALVGLSRAYPEIDIEQYATPAGLVAFKDLGTRCLGGTLSGNPELLTPYAFKKGTTYFKDPNFLDLPEMQVISKENTLGQYVPKIPMLIFEGTVDELMPLDDVDNLVKYYCAGHATVQYNHLLGAGHLIGGASLINGLSYVMDRFNGKPAPSNCK
ncbi:MAG: lipase family protein [Aquabacterium sp.]